MKTAADRKSSCASKRNVIPRKRETLEPVPFFELRDRAVFLFPINIFAVNQVSSPFLTTNFDGLGQQRICRAFIGVGFHRNDLHDSGDIVHQDEFDEPNHLTLKEGADEFASVQISAVFGLDSVDGLAVMPELPPLTNWSFIVNIADATHELVVEVDTADSNSATLRASNVFACFLRQGLPPWSEFTEFGNGDIVPLEMKRVTRLTVRKRTRESKNITRRRALAKSG